MDASRYGWIGEALVSGVVLAVCVWQLISVRRVIARRREREARERETLRQPGEGL